MALPIKETKKKGEGGGVRERERERGDKMEFTAFASYVLALMKSQPAKDICPQDKLRLTAFNFKMGPKQSN